MQQIRRTVLIALTCLATVSLEGSPVPDAIIFEKWLPDASGERWGDSVEIWVVRPDGSDLRRLSSGAYDIGASWSPDKDRIAYCRADGGIRVFNLENSSVLELEVGDRALTPEWLNNSTLLYVAPGSSEDEFPKAWRLFSIALAEGKSSLWPTGDLKGIFSPVLSTDKKLIAFHGWEKERPKVFVAEIHDVAGTKRVVLDGEGYPVAWAPDNASVAVLQGTRCTEVAVDGTIRRTFQGVQECNLSWSPTGERIVFQHQDAIWVMDSDGKNREVVVEPTDGSHYHAPVWK